MKKLLLGVDGGGTGCRAIVANAHGVTLSTAHGGPANIMTDFDNARDNIVQVASAALREAGYTDNDFERLYSVIGVAGANIDQYQRRLKVALPFRQSLIENDSTIALQGALGRDDGVVAAIGTGSIFVYRIDGRTGTTGGWGHMVGDQASGAWLGKRLLHDTLLCFDGIYPQSELYSNTMAQFQHSAETIVDFAHTAQPAEFANFAKGIMDSASCNDSLATRIVQSAVADLELILGKLLDAGEYPLCLLGSLGIRYTDYLSGRFKKNLQQPKGNAVTGAIELAIERFGHSKC